MVEKNRDLSPPLITRTATLNQGKRGIWQLELSRSLLPLLIVTLLMLVPGLLLGLVTFVALKFVPMRAFHLALQEIAVRKTTEERLAKSLSIFSATLESTADGIFATDVLGRVVVANQRFVDLWNLPRSAITGVADSETLSTLAAQLRDPEAFFYHAEGSDQAHRSGSRRRPRVAGRAPIRVEFPAPVRGRKRCGAGFELPRHQRAQAG
ncbi:hypothetical protein ACFS07_04415 [Undibacterium arcticum]